MKQGVLCDLEKKEKMLGMGLPFEWKTVWWLIDLKGSASLPVQWGGN